jgi:hypothetical protein
MSYGLVYKLIRAEMTTENLNEQTKKLSEEAKKSEQQKDDQQNRFNLHLGEGLL